MMRSPSALLLLFTAVACACSPIDDAPYEPVPARAPQPPLPASMPTLEELALSPRADARAEVAALDVDNDRWVARDATVTRTAADFAAITTALPDLSFGFGDRLLRPNGVYGSFIYAPGDVDIDERIANALPVVSARAEALGGELVQIEQGHFAARWPARLQPAFIDETFSAIDAVEYASAGREDIQDGSVVASEQFDVDGKTVWLMLNHDGDCPEGCTELQASRVRVVRNDDALVVDLLGTFDSLTDEVCPEWLTVDVCGRF